LFRSREYSNRSAHDVANVDDRTPRRAIALDENSASCNRGSNKVIQNHVQPQARGCTIRSSIAHERWRETVVRQFFHIALYENFGLAIGGHRVQRRSFIQEVIACRTVSTTRRSKHVALYSSLFRQLSQFYRSVVIDVIGQITVQIAQRV